MSTRIRNRSVISENLTAKKAKITNLVVETVDVTGELTGALTVKSTDATGALHDASSAAAGTEGLVGGVGASASGLGGSVALGAGASAHTTGVALGHGCDAGLRGVAIGDDADGGFRTGGVPTHDSGIAIGAASKAEEEFTTAVGAQTRASGANSTAVGFLAQATGLQSCALGADAEANGTESVALGHDATTSALIGCISIGGLSRASDVGAVSIGYNSYSHGVGNVTIGDDAQGGDETIGVGDRAIAIGKSTRAHHESAIALGGNAQANAIQTVCIGQGITSAVSGSLNLLHRTGVNGNVAVFNSNELGESNITLNQVSQVISQLQYDTNGILTIFDATANLNTFSSPLRVEQRNGSVVTGSLRVTFNISSPLGNSSFEFDPAFTLQPVIPTVVGTGTLTVAGSPMGTSSGAIVVNGTATTTRLKVIFDAGSGATPAILYVVYTYMYPI